MNFSEQTSNSVSNNNELHVLYNWNQANPVNKKRNIVQLRVLYIVLHRKFYIVLLSI